jgi:WD40 repeat protein
MELPTELWSSILIKTRSIMNCHKLYTALPAQTRAELKDTYYSHKERLNIKIFCGFQNKLILFNTTNFDNPKFKFQLEDIFTVQYIQDWDTPIGKKDCIIVATKNGLVMFWDANTMEYIQGLEIGSNICDIEFHPKKSILLTVGQKWIGRELKIWKFDKYWSIIRISIEVIGDDKKFYYFHPTEPDVYIFSSYCSRKISKMYFCNYDVRFPSIMNRIPTCLYLDNYYEPLKINEDGTFECIKNDGSANYFCKFRISNFDIEEIQLQPVCEVIPTILDFLRIGADIYFHANSSDSHTIYKQTGDEYKIIYRTTNKILRMFFKNGFLVFFENEECKCVDLESFEIDGFSIGESPVDFCVI